jgi:hypothetical protein
LITGEHDRADEVAGAAKTTPSARAAPAAIRRSLLTGRGRETMVGGYATSFALMRVVDVWESQAAFDTFAQRLGPAAAQVEGVPEPAVAISELYNVRTG